MSVASKAKERLHLGSDDRPQVVRGREDERTGAQSSSRCRLRGREAHGHARGRLEADREARLEETKDDNISLLAAGVAFFAFLAIFPALIAAVSIYGLIARTYTTSPTRSTTCSAALPGDSHGGLTQLKDITSSSGGTISVGLVVSILGAPGPPGGGIGNLIKGINIAYDEEENRKFLKLRGLALALTVGCNRVRRRGRRPDRRPAGRAALRWPGRARRSRHPGATCVGLIVAVMVALAIVYRYAPDRDNPKFSWSSLGAAGRCRSAVAVAQRRVRTRAERPDSICGAAGWSTVSLGAPPFATEVSALATTTAPGSAAVTTTEPLRADEGRS